MKTKANPREKRTPKPPKRPRQQIEANGVPMADSEDVMTLTEAAAFLRAPVDEIRKMADAAQLPARRIAGEWRFLKSAIRAWLSEPESKPALSSKERMLAAAGAWKDYDEDPEEFIQTIYRNRKKNSVGG